MTAEALPVGHSRRSFLLAGAGSVAAGAGALAGGAAVAGALAGAGAAAQDGPLDDLVGSVVAYVSDVAAGEITLMVDDAETVVTDHQLARTLARLAR